LINPPPIPPTTDARLASNGSNPLTEQTLARLQKLAAGNNIAPESIELLETREHTYKLDGTLQLLPFCEKQVGRPAEAGRNLPVQNFPTFGAMQAGMQAHQQKFLQSRDWLETARTELKQAPAEGWGLDGAKITLPSRSAIFTASEPCPKCQGRQMLTCAQCQGQGSVTCPQCHGQGREVCYNCHGRGENPGQPGQRCSVCQGSRYAPCRYCRATGRQTCPACQGRRGTPCPQCQGQGRMVQEITLVCGAMTQFKIKGEDLPSGLKRGLERLGIANLAKGHADIKTLQSSDNDEKESEDRNDKDDDAPEKPEIYYEAQLPYADLRMRFGGNRAVVVSAFGKRGFMMGVPPFLDEALQPARAFLSDAARGKNTFEKALAARAMRDALILELGKRGNSAALRRIYPFGLMPKTATEIMSDMRRALDRFTLHVRAIAAFFGALLGGGILAAWFLTAVRAQMVRNLPWLAELTIDALVLFIAMASGWVLVGKSMQIVLRREFPKLKVSLRRSIGFVGYTMLAIIGIAGAVLIAQMPEKPIWLDYFLYWVRRV
jgi:hypothetical protein